MGCGKSAARLHKYGDGETWRHGAATFELLLKAEPLKQFHHNIQSSIRHLIEIECAHDIRMLERHLYSGFTPEACHLGGVGSCRSPQYFDGHLKTETQVFCSVNRTNPA